MTAFKSPSHALFVHYNASARLHALRALRTALDEAVLTRTEAVVAFQTELDTTRVAYQASIDEAELYLMNLVPPRTP